MSRLPARFKFREDYQNYFDNIGLGNEVPKGLIDLKGERIGTLAVELFTRGVTKNPSVTKIVLDDNLISAETMAGIAEQLKTNQTVTHLSLRDNPIFDAGIQSLISMLEVNKTLELIDVDNTYSSQQIRTTLANKLEKNAKIAKAEKRHRAKAGAKIGTEVELVVQKDSPPPFVCDESEPDLSEGKRRDDSWLLRDPIGELIPHPDASGAEAINPAKINQGRKK